MFTVATRLNLLLIIVVICFALYIYTINIEINKIDRHVNALEKLVKELIEGQGQSQGQACEKPRPEEPIFVVPNMIVSTEDDNNSICSNDIQNILSSISCLENPPNPIIILEEESSEVSHVFKMSDEQIEKLKNEKLREFLSACNEDTKGNKQVLVDRVKKVVHTALGQQQQQQDVMPIPIIDKVPQSEITPVSEYELKDN